MKKVEKVSDKISLIIQVPVAELLKSMTRADHVLGHPCRDKLER